MAATDVDEADEALEARELERLEARLKQRSGEAADLLATAQDVLVAAAARIEEAHRRDAGEADARTKQVRVTHARRMTTELTAARAALRASLRQWSSVMSSGAWADARWAHEEPPALPAVAVRVGTFAADAELTAMVPCAGTGHVQVVAGRADVREKALGVVNGVLLRTLASAPPGRVRFRIHDPKGLGASLDAYSQFDRQRVAHGNPTSTAHELDEVVAELGARATEVSATYLRGVHRTLRDYLADDPHADVGFEVLVLLDLPRGLEQPLLERISVLAGQGPARGIMLVTLQTGPVAGLDLGPDGVSVEVHSRDEARLAGLTASAVRLDPSPPAALVRRVAARAVAARAALGFASLHDGPPAAATSADGLETPIGRSGREPVSVRLGDDPVNGLIAGIAGSGKSILLRTFIYGLARRYAASELQLYLLDFKEGVEFQEFAPTALDRTFLPHAAVVSVNSSREFGLEVLRHLNKLIADRYALFSSSGSAPKLAGLRAARPDLRLPRIVLVVDEFQRIFDTDDALSMAAVDELVNIAKQGRAAGVHFVLATQSIGDVGAGTSVGLRLDGVFKNASLRIGMRLSEAESREVFSSSSNTAAATIHEAGVAIVNTSGGNEAFNRRTVVAFVDDAVALDERRSAVASTTTGRIPPRTFDGARGADPAANRALRAAVRGRGHPELWQCWPAQALRVGVEDPRVTEGVAASLGRDPRRNIAVIGAGLANAVAIVQWSVLGLAAGRPSARFLLVDLLRPEDRSEYGVPDGLVDATASAMELLGAGPDVLRGDDVTGLVSRLGVPGASEPTAVAIFGGLERLRGRGERTDPEGFETAEDLLRQRLAEASNDHVHTLASFATRDDFEVLDRGQAFGLRMYLQVPATTLMALSGVDAAVPSGRLALWHDLLNARAPVPVHCYEPFGRDAIPDWLRR